jgi:peroxiredoxin
MKQKLLSALFLMFTLSLFADMPKAGDTAPAFEGTDQDGKTVKLADFAGKKNVLPYFIG